MIAFRCARCVVGPILLLCTMIAAAAYPERPIRFVIASAAGGSPDVAMRILTAELRRQMKVQFVIDKRPGGGQMIGTEMIARATRDGHTIRYAQVVNPAIHRSP